MTVPGCAGDEQVAGSYPVTDLAEFFAGRWWVDRDIVDDAGQRMGTFAGTASFTAGEPGLVYQEQGVLELGAHRGPARRALRYRVCGPGQAWVYFDYGDFFHELDLRQGWWRTSHPCRDDLYRGEYRVCGPDRWRQEWTVAGPAKNYAMSTGFNRSR